MDKCIVYAITTQKGGCGKTTTAMNLGVGMHILGNKKVCLIDLDSQANLSQWLGITEPGELRFTSADIMKAGMMNKLIRPEDIILTHPEGVDFIPANANLGAFQNKSVKSNSKELILKRFVDSIRDSYDCIIIDTGPSLGLLTINALCAADRVIIPCPLEFLCSRGLDELIDTITNVRKKFNDKLVIDGVLYTMCNKDFKHSREVERDIIKNHPGLNIYNSAIRHTIKFSQASKASMSVYKYVETNSEARKTDMATNYSSFTTEVLRNGR